MKNSKLRDIAFLSLIVLSVYFPAITNVINSVDDGHIINAYANTGQQTLQKILIPGNQFYFRPLIELTYYLDNLLWELDPRIMHLENILLHLLNVIMLYLVATRVSFLAGDRTSLPLMSALLFAVHPANTEAVSWIAGRTDPLAALFVLFSIFCLVEFVHHGLLRHFVVSFVAMILAILAKEISIMLLPVSLGFIYLLRREGSDDVLAGWKRQTAVTVYLLFGLMLLAYAAARLFLKPGGSHNAFTTMFERKLSLVPMVVDILATLGFYVKKFFVPVPLNFAIDGVSAWYMVPGGAAFLVLVYMLKRRTVLMLFAVAGLAFIAPAVVVRLAGLNWTPVAERYLYIPSAFATIGLSGMLVRRAMQTRREALLVFVFAGVTLFFAGLTFSRNLTWRDNLSLYRDAVAKSPEFGDIHNELGVALMERGECQEARKHFEVAQKNSHRPLIREFAELNMLKCVMEGKSLAEKREILQRYLDSHNAVQPQLVVMLKDILYEMHRLESDADIRAELLEEIIPLNNKIYQMLKDPHCLYRNGQHQLVLGDRTAALESFRKALAKAPVDAFYYESAKKLVERLER